MASITQKISQTDRLLLEANDLSQTDSPDLETIERLISACSTLLEVVRRQEERTQRIAIALDGLAGKISYLSTSPTEVREQVQLIARLIRDERQE